jgi:hypothetical protein
MGIGRSSKMLVPVCQGIFCVLLCKTQAVVNGAHSDLCILDSAQTIITSKIPVGGGGGKAYFSLLFTTVWVRVGGYIYIYFFFTAITALGSVIMFL